jgi:WD40 repeat protein
MSMQNAHDIEHPLPPELGTCVVIHEFLSAAECAAYISAAEQRGFRTAETDYPPSYRNNERQVIDDDLMSEKLLRRLRQYAPGNLTVSTGGMTLQSWNLIGLNERIRICRYKSGECFNIHQDGVHYRANGLESKLTFMIYLTDGSEFEGGDTAFYASGPGRGEDSETPHVIARVRPRRGTLIMFDHGIWHAGETVTSGVKHILRSDLLYRQSDDSLSNNAFVPFSGEHHGYVWSVIQLSDGRIASCGRDGQIVVWNADGVKSMALVGHRQSVLGLAEIRPGVIASISRDRTLRYWDLSTGKCTAIVEAHEAAVLAIARLPDGSIATGGADHEIRMWASTGDTLATLSEHTGWVWGVTPVGKGFLASASEDGTVRLWQLSDNSCITVSSGTTPLRTIDAQPDNCSDGESLVAAGDSEGWIRLFRVNDAGFCTSEGKFRAHAAAVRRVRFLSDGRLASCGEDNLMRIWAVTDRQLVHERRHGNCATDVAELAPGKLLSCGYDGINAAPI